MPTCFLAASLYGIRFVCSFATEEGPLGGKLSCFIGTSLPRVSCSKSTSHPISARSTESLLYWYIVCVTCTLLLSSSYSPGVRTFTRIGWPINLSCVYQLHLQYISRIYRKYTTPLTSPLLWQRGVSQLNCHFDSCCLKVNQYIGYVCRDTCSRHCDMRNKSISPSTGG